MRLYHLTSAEYAISNIALRRLKIAQFNELNDPFELLAVKSSDGRVKGAIEFLKSSHYNSAGLLCFSENWSNPVLWSHYADKHRGICLGFDLTDTHPTPITYVSERMDPILDENGLFTFDFVKELYLTKYDHWQYEKEQRIFMDLNEDEIGKENGMHFHPFNAFLELKEVILGAHCDMSIDLIEHLIDRINYDTISENVDVTITKARLHDEKFEVVAQ